MSTDRVNVALPDKQSLYHAQLMQNFGPDDMFVYVHTRLMKPEKEKDSKEWEESCRGWIEMTLYGVPPCRWTEIEEPPAPL